MSENKKKPTLEKINLQNKLKRNEQFKKKKLPAKLTKELDNNKNSNGMIENTIYNNNTEQDLKPKISNDVKNYDIDKLDEVILNAKKKTLMDSYIDDDNEETLFTEKPNPIVTNKNKNHSPSLQKTNNEKTKQETRKQVIVDNNENILSADNKNNINKSKKRKHDKLHDTASSTHENTNKKFKSTNIVQKNKLRIDKQNTKNNNYIPQDQNQLSNEKCVTRVENNKTGQAKNHINTIKLNNLKNSLSLKQKIKKISISNMFQSHHIKVNGNKLWEKK